MRRIIAYVGKGTGGIEVFEISRDGKSILPLEGGIAGKPEYAGFLAYSKGKQTLYAVDERKNAGRNVPNPTCVHAYRIDPATGALSFRNMQPTIGCFAAAVCVSPDENYVYTANHGWFDCVIKAVETADGHWVNQFVYDDSTVVQYPVNPDGSLKPACDVFVLTGHGIDPNNSPQAGGHAQASAHAHIVKADPGGKFLLVCDKSSEKIYVFRLGGSKFQLASVYQLPMFTGPRHCAFDNNGHVFLTCEFSSELWCLDFDSESGTLKFNNKVPTVPDDFTGHNELATLQVTPDGKLVFANNRGANTIVGFSIAGDGTMTLVSTTSVGSCIGGKTKESIRDLKLMPGGRVLLVPVRPDDVLRAYAIAEDGSLTPLTEYPISHPVNICLVELEG